MQKDSLLFLNVARLLRYRTLTPMLGQTVMISSRTLIATETAALVSRFVDGCSFAGPTQKNLDGQIAKYGILDLHFDAPSSILDADADTGVPLLRDLGFVDNGIEDLAEGRTGILADCLNILHDGIEENKTHLLLFIESTEPNVPKMTVTERFQRIHDPSIIRFPITFKVVDACVSNSLAVWMNKHFYL